MPGALILLFSSFCSLLAAVAASNTPFLFSVEASTDKRKEEELSPPVQAGGLKGFLFFLKGEAALRKNKRMPLVVSMIFPLGLGAQRKNRADPRLPPSLTRKEK